MREYIHNPFQRTSPCAAEERNFLNKISTSTVLHILEARTALFRQKIQNSHVFHFLNHTVPVSTAVLQNVQKVLILLNTLEGTCINTGLLHL